MMAPNKRSKRAPPDTRNQPEKMLSSPALIEIAQSVTRILKDAGEFTRVHVGKNENSEILKIYTLATDHQLRFSVLAARPENVHMRKLRYVSAFTDPISAGWPSTAVADFKAPNQHLALSTLAVINDIATDWLTLKPDNAKTPRTQFMVRDGLDYGPSPLVAGSFVVTAVRFIGAGKTFQIVLSNAAQNCEIKLSPEQSANFNSPMSIKGCRVVVHSAGQVRVLREASFNNLYKLEE